MSTSAVWDSSEEGMQARLEGFNLPREGVQVEAADELGALGLAGLGAFLVGLVNEIGFILRNARQQESCAYPAFVLAIVLSAGLHILA